MRELLCLGTLLLLVFASCKKAEAPASIAPVLATITTTTASGITSTSATSGGEITKDGGASITERGICYDTTANPTKAKNKTVSGTGSGSFTSDMTGLVPGTTYYVRAYAINIAGTAYGNGVSFKTTSILATITTTTVSDITSTTANSGGNITNDGGAPITERGICYDTTANPTTAKNKVASGNSTGSFTSTMTSLAANTNYYVRAYAINSAGTAYGNEVSFKTASTIATITTTTVSAITSTSATSGGEITNDGGTSITERGICYNTSVSPTILNNKVVSGSGAGIFAADMTGLAAATIYYVRAYAKNSTGIAYGNEVSFKTASTIATITTTIVSAITSTSATSGGNITKDGGASISERGICYNTTSNPTTADSKIVSGSGIGSFTANMSGLTMGTTYYVRAYAMNSAGIAYGNEVNFKTSSLATITTLATSDYETNGIFFIRSGGNITNNGGASVTETGLCYSTSHNPTTADGKALYGYGNFTGTFYLSIWGNGVTAGTIYYIRAYAINSAGTSYGNEVTGGVATYACVNSGWPGASAYNPTITGIHPIIYANNSMLPQTWKPSTTDLVELVVCDEEVTTLIQTCYYTGGQSYRRYNRHLNLTLREAKTGNVVATKTFYASSPASCPSTTIYGGSDSGIIDYAAINNWLQNYVVK